MQRDERGLVDGVLRKVALALVGLVVLVLVAYFTGLLGAPSVVAVENRFGDVDNSTTAIETDLVVNNPNPIGVRLGGANVSYTVRMNGIDMATGGREGIPITRSNTTLNFTTRMQNDRIPPWFASHVRRGETTTLAIDARVRSSLLGRTFAVPQERTIETDLIGQFNSTETRPVNADQQLVENPVLYINETSAAWGTVTDQRTPINMRMQVFNPKATPYTITEVGYNVTMNDVLVARGASQTTHVIEGRTTETLEPTAEIRNARLDEWWVSHLERDQVTDLTIDFYARLELPAGATIRLPLNELTYTERIETDIFGTKDEPADDDVDGAEDGADEPTGTATPGSTPTDDGGLGVTPTPTAATGGTATPTDAGATPTPGPGTESPPGATPSPTPTDGGLLG